MDVREKLVELLLQEDDVCKPNECKDCGANGSCYYHRTADKMIANGVTVQEWISVNECMPEDLEENKGKKVINCTEMGKPPHNSDRENTTVITRNGIGQRLAVVPLQDGQ